MSSSQPFLPSSPLSLANGSQRKSKFTFRNLSQLGVSATSCPLRVIAHIDLDAFYAQCEGVRLGISENQPLAVQQWQGLIAINYPARDYGLTRHITITEAKKLCPDLIMQHVATWKEGDEKWAYHENAFANIATHKVSLDPYRLQSRRILACIKDILPAPPLQKVEKASVDEVFLDLSAQIHSLLVQRYPELAGPAPYDDPTELLPRPPTTVLDWTTDALVDLDASETEDDDPDWDDVAMQIGSEIVRSVRVAIKEQLRYTCSAGIARNKMLAKLGSAHKKPNQQTVVRNRATQQFLGSFKFTKIRNLGGKLGEQVATTFATDQVKDLLGISIDQFKSKIGDDTGTWLYHVIRGEETSEVNPRTQIKSMLSAKSFRPTINTYEQAVRWLRIFAADIYSRLVEEGVAENKRRPKTINLHHRQGAQMRSRQAPLPSGRSIDEMLLFDISKNLLAQIIVDGRAWPCSNLQLSVGGFEDGPIGNRGIGGFLVRGEEAKTTSMRMDKDGDISMHNENRPSKRVKIDNGGMRKFLHRKEFSHEETDELSSSDHQQAMASEDSLEQSDQENRKPKSPSANLSAEVVEDSAASPPISPAQDKVENCSDHYHCSRCNKAVPEDGRNEHDDWHFARELQAQTSTDNALDLPPSKPAKIERPVKDTRKAGRGRPSGLQKADKGQTRLTFGT